MVKTEKLKRNKKHKKKHNRKKKSKLGKRNKEDKSAVITAETIESNYAIPLDLMCSKSHAPETPEEYQLRQKKIRHETDPVTGRQRLIKGDGEVLEEIVSRKRHLEINKLATQGDGRFFQENLKGNVH